MAWDHCPSAESFLKRGVKSAIEKCVRKMSKTRTRESLFDLKIISQAMEEMEKKFPDVIFELKLIAKYNAIELNSKKVETGVAFSIHDYATRRVLALITLTKKIGLTRVRRGGCPWGRYKKNVDPI